MVRTAPRLVAAVAMVMALTVLSSCSGLTGQRQSTATLTPSPVKQVDLDRAAVQRTLVGYRQAVQASLAPTAGAVALSRIRRVVAEPYATRLAGQLATEREQGIRMRGRESYDDVTVRLHGSRATMVACWDPTRSGLVNTSVSPPARVSTARPRLTTFAVSRTPNGWRISGRTPGKRC